MDVHVLVTAAGSDRPPSGTPVVVEIRDTSKMDVASRTLSAGRTVVGDVEGSVSTSEAGLQLGTGVPQHRTIASLDLTVPDGAPPDPRGPTVWARVATSDHEHITSGDWITVQAYPMHAGPGEPEAGEAQTVVVEVVRV